MSRISPLFERLRTDGRLGLITYVTVGYPRLDSTPDIVAAMVGAGADLVELGVPFSDPLAEGRTVQATSQRALANGVSVAHCLETARLCRQRTEAPMVFMGYLNPILAYGVERFCAAAAAAGIDGLIVPDISMEETAELHRACQGAGLDLVFFVAPTTTEARMRHVAELASGFIYCIAVTGVTGSRDEIAADVDKLLAKIRELTSTPLALGFGISRPEHLAQLKGKVDAAIVGSALLDRITEDDPAGSAAAFVREMLGPDSRGEAQLGD
jgi:tryptophan synthase alpha chain